MAPNFKVAIVGGGPIGLTAALALSQANIDFMLFEKYPTVVPEVGSDIVLSPVGTRALSQLGLYDELVATSTVLGTIKRIDHQGNDLGDRYFFDIMQELVGQRPRMVRRYHLCQILYKALPPSCQQNIFSSKAVSEVHEMADGVKVVCSDGTSYTADMVVGADGVHSTARSQMPSRPAPDGVKEGNFLPAAFRCLWIRFPSTGLPIGAVFETHGRGASTQLFVCDDFAGCGLYEQLPAPLNERVRYTQEDEEAVVRRWSDLPMTPDGRVTLGDLYKAKKASGLVPMQEGVREQWSSGARTVLVGDAKHAFSPITGAGCNQGIIDVAVVVNKLHELLGKTEGKPQTEDLAKVFASYESARKDQVKAQCQMAIDLTLTSAWASLFRRVLDQYIFALPFVQRWFMNKLVTQMKEMAGFDFLPVPAEARVGGA